MTDLSIDAITFGLGFLRGPKSKLSFGGDGAKMGITPRARAALDELIAAGYAEPAKPDDQIPNREHYRGTDRDPHLGQLGAKAAIDPLDDAFHWKAFSKISDDQDDRPSLGLTIS